MLYSVPRNRALPVEHRLIVEFIGQPGRGIRQEIPPDGIRAVLLQRLEGADGVALGFGHLLAKLILHMAEHNHVLEGGLIEQQGGNRQQGIEPAAGLIHRLGDEVRRELRLEQFLIFRRG